MNIEQLRFLTDENIDSEVVMLLRERGFDVLDIKEEKLFRLSDKAILEMALEQKRVVISQDSDFGTLVFRDSNPFYGILYLRPGHESPQFHTSTLLAILDADLSFSIPFILVAENTGEIVKMRLREF